MRVYIYISMALNRIANKSELEKKYGRERERGGMGEEKKLVAEDGTCQGFRGITSSTRTEPREKNHERWKKS